MVFFSAKVKNFNKLTPILSDQTNIRKFTFCDPNGCVEHVGNAFMIANDGKLWKMNEIVDVLGFMGEVDTPAEAQLLLWLYSKPEGSKYRKTFKGYEVLIKREKTYPSDKGDKSIGEFCEEWRIVTDKAIINKKGKIVSYKQVGISKKSNLSCIHPAQMIVDGVAQ